MPQSEPDRILLARIDERTRILNDSLALLTKDMKNNYVTHLHFESFKKEMKPLKQGFYAFVSCIVFTVLIAILGQVLKK